MQRYSYPPLSTPTSVRLLVLSKRHNESFHQLEETELDDNPGFEALSYTWQDPDADNPGGQDGSKDFHLGESSSLRITNNLDTILNHLKASLAPNTSRKIWIDQICINQEDLEERGQQVSIMHRIYRQAEQTIIWLGRPNQYSAPFLNLVKSFTHPAFDWESRISGPLHEELFDRIQRILGPRDIQETEKKFSKEEYLSALVNTLNRIWFSRAWVVQEAALSSKPLVMHGSETFDLRILDYLVVLIASLEKEETGTIRDLRVLKTRGAQMLRHIQSCRQRVLELVDRRGRLTFLDLLQKFAFAVDATDARDQVYAFLAFQDSQVPAIKPDYTLQTSAAYAMISANIAQNTGSLSILGLVRGKLYPGPLPSWAVDWRKPQTTQGKRLDGPEHCYFNASRERLHIKSTTSVRNDNRLVVRGRIVDRIGVISDVNRLASDKQPFDNIRLYEELAKISHLLPKWNSWDEATRMEMIKRLFAVLIAHDPDPNSTLTERQIDLIKLLDMYNNHSSLENRATSNNQDRQFRATSRILSHRANICVRKRVFIGADQNLLGLGPIDIATNDLICILHGSKVPVMLKPRIYGYEVVGQCYYEEWMYGNLVAWDEDEADELTLI